ncbi:MAG: ROK family protein [Halanaerobiales bacterium]
MQKFSLFNFLKKNKNRKEESIKTLEEMSEDLAILIDNLKNALDFDTCVIGGGFHIYQDIILDILNKIFSLKKYDYMKTPSILFSTQGNNSGLIGAGLLVHNNIEMKKS